MRIHSINDGKMIKAALVSKCCKKWVGKRIKDWARMKQVNIELLTLRFYISNTEKSLLIVQVLFLVLK